MMAKALGIHNNMVRKARWTAFGYTVEQEGDSYTLCFYDAVDAVSFCLQVSWPHTAAPLLLDETSCDGSSALTALLLSGMSGDHSTVIDSSIFARPPHRLVSWLVCWLR
jgi:hypothetical protein